MRRLSSAIILLLCVGLALLGCTDRSQSVVAPTEQGTPGREQGSLGKAVRVDFTGTETLEPPYLPIDPGTVNCPGGELTGGYPPCTEGSRVHARGMKYIFLVETTDPRLNGVEEVVSNANVDGWTPYGPGSGHIWGTIHLTVMDNGTPTGGTWTGTWTGTRTVNATGASSSISVVAHGRGNGVGGLKAHWNLSYSGGPVGYCEGYILVPGKK